MACSGSEVSPIPPVSLCENSPDALCLRWRVPEEPILRYHLFFGPGIAQLNRHKVVEVPELEKIKDPKLGPLFCYRLASPPKGRFYLSIQAENEYGRSKPTKPFRLSFTPNHVSK